MARPLLVACDHRFVEDVLDHLGGDVDVDVTFSPTPQQWQAAPVVLLDARSRSTADRLPARRNVLVIVGSTATPTQVADLYRGWLEARCPATVYQWPYGTETVRRVIAGPTAAAAVPRVRVGVIGGHGGAGASTLAVALAQAACYAGRRTVLVDGDPLGGGIGARLDGGLEDPALLRIVSHAEVRARFGGLVDVVSQMSGEVLIADLSRPSTKGNSPQPPAATWSWWSPTPRTTPRRPGGS